MSQGDSSAPVVDSRQKKRFKTHCIVEATFGGLQGTVLDLGEGGFQIEHAGSIKLKAKGPIEVKNPETSETLSIGSTVVWSHLSNKTDDDGRLLYRTGLRIDDPIESSAPIFGRLIHACGSPDEDSLERKRRAMIERQQARERAAADALARKDVPSSTPIE